MGYFLMSHTDFTKVHFNIKISVYFQPAHNTATNIDWQLPEVVLTQFVSPDDEHDVLETCREL
jgi:hypothetical protein